MALAVLDQRETLNGMEEVHGWWTETVRKSEHFFNIISLFDVYTATGEYLITLQMIQTRLEKAPFPMVAANARRQLLTSISSVTSAVCAALAGNHEIAHAHMDTASVSLCALDQELTRMGITQ
jgi:hypothetical protein